MHYTLEFNITTSFKYNNITRARAIFYYRLTNDLFTL